MVTTQAHIMTHRDDSLTSLYEKLS